MRLTHFGRRWAVIVGDSSRSRGVLAALERDPLTAGLRTGLVIETLPWSELGVLFERMASTGELHPDVLAAGITALGNWAGRTDNAELVRLEAELSGKSDERLRRLGLAALVVRASLPEGWNEERIGRLRGYRQDPSPLVAAAAQFTLPAEEEQMPLREKS